MYVRDLRKDFFDIIVHNRVLVLANFDVDSICAVKILLWLLRCDHVVYKLVPIRGKSDLIQAWQDNVGTVDGSDPESTANGVKYVVMINCGGTLDVVEFLQPPDDVTVFIADSHRPTDVCNIYSDGQIQLLMKQEEDEGKFRVLPRYGPVLSLKGTTTHLYLPLIFFTILNFKMYRNMMIYSMMRRKTGTRKKKMTVGMPMDTVTMRMKTQRKVAKGGGMLDLGLLTR